MAIKIESIAAGPLATNCYLVVSGRSAVLIDAPPDSFELATRKLREENVVLEKILLTHSHWDHAADAGVFYEKTKAPVLICEKDNYRLLEPNENSVFPLPFVLEPFAEAEFFEDGEEIPFGDSVLEALWTPGHTEGSSCFVAREAKSIFSGDLIFKNSVGRTDLPGGNFDDLLRSIKEKIFKFENDYNLLPGHGETTTVGREKKLNPFIY